MWWRDRENKQTHDIGEAWIKLPGGMEGPEGPLQGPGSPTPWVGSAALAEDSLKPTVTDPLA